MPIGASWFRAAFRHRIGTSSGRWAKRGLGSRRLDLNGDNTYDGDDIDSTNNTFTRANEWNERKDAVKGTHNYAHDVVGNMIDDGREHDYVYDPFGRLPGH